MVNCYNPGVIHGLVDGKWRPLTTFVIFHIQLPNSNLYKLYSNNIDGNISSHLISDNGHSLFMTCCVSLVQQTLQMTTFKAIYL